MSSQPPQKSLLPVPAGVSHQRGRRDQEERVPQRRGAALQLNEFNLFVGRFFVFLGVTGNCIEIFTSAKALYLRLAPHTPVPQTPGAWLEVGLCLFFALVFQGALWSLVVNLNDSWVSILSGHTKDAFVSKGEVSLHLVMLMCFQVGGAAINGLCDVIFLADITNDPLIIGLGTAALLLSSILLWPLGWKLVRYAKNRINLVKRAAQALADQQSGQQPGYSVREVSGSLVRQPGSRNR